MKTQNNRVFALIWRIVGFVLGISGIVITTLDASGFMSSTLVFFTVQTNIFSTALFAVLASISLMQIIKQGKNGEVASINGAVQLAFTLYITITFLVYWLALSWAFGFGEGAMGIISCLLVHGIVPLFAIADWFMFMPHGRLKKRYAFYWLSYPLLYFIFCVIRANCGGPLYVQDGVEMFYPYFFIEPQFLGSPWLLIPVVLACCVLFYLLGRLYIFLDNKLAQRFNVKQEDTVEQQATQSEA